MLLPLMYWVAFGKLSNLLEVRILILEKPL